MKRPKIPTNVPYLTTIIALTIVVIVLSVVLLQPNRPTTIDEKIIKKANFNVLAPSDYTAINQKSVSFDQNVGGISYSANLNDVTYAVSEQPTPDTFADSPNVYGYKLDQMRQFQDIQTSVGKITLTKPVEFGGQVVGVSNLNGTLMFVRADKQLNASQWKDFYDNLELIR
jgi:hypothetical protein